jgi:hypothetical protein
VESSFLRPFPGSSKAVKYQQFSNQFAAVPLPAGEAKKAPEKEQKINPEVVARPRQSY